MLWNAAGQLVLPYRVPRRQRAPVPDVFDTPPSVSPESGLEVAMRSTPQRQLGPNGPVDIRVGSRRFPCVLAAGADDRDWCVAKVVLPKGASTLVMRYRESFSAVFDERAECPFATFHAPLGLNYDFQPAGYWAGPVGTVEVRLDLGPLDGLEQVRGPAGHRKEKQTLRWEFRDVDLKALAPLDVEFDANEWQLSRWLASAPRARRAKAVSPVSDARALVDGDARSGWYPNASGSAELSWPLRTGDRLCGLVVGRLPTSPAPALRVEACATSAASDVRAWFEAPSPPGTFVVKATPLDPDGYPTCFNLCEHFQPRSDVERDTLASAAGPSACVRLELASADGGAAGCLGEVTPLFMSDRLAPW